MRCSSVRPLWFQGNRSRCPTQKNKFDRLSLYGGLHGLSFDPTNTHALLCAVNALKSTKEPRPCSIQTSCLDSQARQSSHCSYSKSSSSSSDSFAAPSTPAPIPCPSNASGPAQSSSVSEAVETNCSSNSTSTTSRSQENSSQGKSQRDSNKGSVQAQAGAGASTKGSEKIGLTWIDWGWPGTHTPCPFNQRHTVDDILIRPERVGFVNAKNEQEAL